MHKPLKQCETRVFRTYRGGKLLDEFLGKEHPVDCFQPEDWISSFTEAKNKNYIPNEGITRVISGSAPKLICDIVQKSDFGKGRENSGVLIKLLDSAERLGIQVHPTPAFSRKHFNSPYGKTECWHILGTRNDMDSAVYVGFKEGITREKWKHLFEKQDIQGMLSALHRFEVKAGDTILVKAGSPHAIGAGCFLLEIQEPCDYTMRMEKTTVSGEMLTPMQIHYGIGEEALLDCFIYEPLSRKQAREKFFMKADIAQNKTYTHYSLVSYKDTPCFQLEKVRGEYSFSPNCFVTLVITGDGMLSTDQYEALTKRGDKFFIPYGCGQITLKGAEAIICFPPA